MIDYKSSGVDVKAGEKAVKSISEMVRSTYNDSVMSELGSFGGLYRLNKSDWEKPVLVSSTDGVGTKLLVAIMAQRFDTVGQDLVNHCVNDILVQGAIPQFFLDYIGVGKLEPDHIQSVVSGLVKACRENSCALIGGEMAEMPGIYQVGDFDLVGTIVGCVDQENLLPASRIKSGDILMGIASSGLHTNGYSLARK
ncbi:MAG: phosphoribosylformylglycinamidine cyclo-ligase, partial [Candidatus Cloacimonadaceae bacterium]|nr:phosphoribosylformylglycinamidine cyclo-ligase [Candidatus Cloacimonadaceae bacterium]